MLLCCVLLSTVFFIFASAETKKVSTVVHTYSLCGYVQDSFTFKTNDGIASTKFDEKYYQYNDIKNYPIVADDFSVYFADGSILFEKDKTYCVDIYNILNYHWFGYLEASWGYDLFSVPYEVTAVLCYTDGTVEQIDGDFSSGSTSIDAFFEFKPNRDVNGFRLQVRQRVDFPSNLSNHTVCSEYQLGEGSEGGFTIVVEEVSLLYGALLSVRNSVNDILKSFTNLPQFVYEKFSNTIDIIKNKVSDIATGVWSIPTNIFNKFSTVLNNIYDKITENYSVISNLPQFFYDKFFDIISIIQNKVSDIATGVWVIPTNIFNKFSAALSNIYDTVAKIPSVIWEKIENGFRFLFVPTDEQILDFKSGLNSSLKEKFGAVYQVGDIFANKWNCVIESGQTHYIDFPSATIKLPDNNSFTFGGYKVKVVPEGFEWLAVTVKSFFGIVFTLAFVNGLRKKYDEVMGVEK